MQKKLIVLGILIGLLAGALAAPAMAGKKKKKPKTPPAAAQPVPTTMFLEGTNRFGEQDAGPLINPGSPVPPGQYLKLTKEAGTGEKSMGIPSYSVGPNNRCAGNSLFPVFVGNVTGTVKGDIKVTFEAVGTPGSKAEVRVWPDLPATPSAPICNDAYVEPAGAVVVNIPSSRGAVEAVIPGMDFPATSTILIQLTGVAGSIAGGPTVPPFYARAFYGLETTKVEFPCLPAAGAASCLP